jgi:hypothetical protein
VEEGNMEKSNLFTIVKAVSQAFVIAVTVLCFTPVARGIDIRTLSTQEDGTTYYTPSVPLSVTIRVIPDKRTESYAVEDVPPTGWVVTRINENGQWDNVNKKVKWGPFSDRNMRTFTYQVTAPVGETGVKIFSGIVIFDGIATSIVGDLVVEPALLGPADGRQGVRSP